MNIKRHLAAAFILAATAIAAYPAEQDHSPSQALQEISRTMTEDPVFADALVGICVRTADGQTLAEVNAEKMLVPASNMKLVTTGAALHALGPDYRYKTRLAYEGNIIRGTLKGNLYIIGGGDPLTGSKDSIAAGTEAMFKEWEKMVREAGIRNIEGHVVGDGRWLEGMIEEPTWLWNDIGTYYGSGVTGLMFYENMQSFSVSAGERPGAPLDIAPDYPQAPWMTFRYSCTTGEQGTGDRLYMYTSDLAPVAEIRGTFGVDRAKKRVDCSNKFPEYTCAYHFARWLDRHGISCTGGARDFRLHPAEQPAGSSSGLTIIGETLSPALERIVFETNHASNNLFAETLLRTLGKEMHGSSCYDSSYVALNDALAQIGVSPRGAKVQDGSGLSRQNYVSPDFLCRFLESMMSSPSFGSFIRSLPVPGGNGTLSYNMKSYPASMKARIRVKSGSMNGVRCYSGYILPSGYSDYGSVPEEMKGKTIVFSIMVNNCTSPNWKVRPMLDKMMASIAKCN